MKKFKKAIIYLQPVALIIVFIYSIRWAIQDWRDGNVENEPIIVLATSFLMIMDWISNDKWMEIIKEYNDTLLPVFSEIHETLRYSLSKVLDPVVSRTIISLITTFLAVFTIISVIDLEKVMVSGVAIFNSSFYSRGIATLAIITVILGALLDRIKWTTAVLVCTTLAVIVGAAGMISPAN